MSKEAEKLLKEVHLKILKDRQIAANKAAAASILLSIRLQLSSTCSSVSYNSTRNS